jgi:hypothetical protein
VRSLNVDPNGIIAKFYRYGNSKDVYFASSTDLNGSFGPNGINAFAENYQPAAMNLMLIGTIGDSLYGQVSLT